MLLQGKYASAIIMIDNVDETTVSQTIKMLNSPVFKGANIRIMPDTHAGKGSVIGFTSTYNKEKPMIIPNIVGVDLNCAIYTFCLGIDFVKDISAYDDFIRNEIPHGFNINTRRLVKADTVEFDLQGLKDVCDTIHYDYDHAMRSLGTLGGGNHFIELGQDPAGNQWLSIHTGSRKFGKEVAEYYQRWAQYLHPEEPKELAYLDDSTYATEYLNAMRVTQKFAHMNRMLIANRIMDYLGYPIPLRSTQTTVFSVHNYIDLGQGYIRKGAISAQKDQMVVIPFNQRDGIAIAKGLGNPDWNYSAPHGAGRIMSRGEAKRRLSLDEYKASMEGIYSTCVDISTIDEAPQAYKDMNMILEAIKPTVDVQFLIKPITVFKDSKE